VRAKKEPGGQAPNPTKQSCGHGASPCGPWRGAGEPKRVDAGTFPEISSRGTIAYVRMGKSGLARWTGQADRSSCSARAKLRRALVSGRKPVDVRFRRVAITPSSVFMMWQRRPCSSWRFGGFRWRSRLVAGRKASPSCAARRSARPPQGYFIAPDKPHPWAIWVPTPPRDPPKKSGAAARHAGIVSLHGGRHRRRSHKLGRRQPTGDRFRRRWLGNTCMHSLPMEELQSSYAWKL